MGWFNNRSSRTDWLHLYFVLGARGGISGYFCLDILKQDDCAIYVSTAVPIILLTFGPPARLKLHTQKVRAYLNTYLDSSEFFVCWRKAFPATQRNYWGGLESDPVTLYANGVDGGEDWMYMIVVVPTVDDEVLTDVVQVHVPKRRLHAPFTNNTRFQAYGAFIAHDVESSMISSVKN